LWARVLLFCPGMLLVQILMVVPVCLLLVLLHLDDLPEAKAMATWFESDQISLQLQMLCALPLAMGSLGLAALFRWGLDRRPVLGMGLGHPALGWGRALGLGFAVGAGPLCACVLALLALGGLATSPPQVTATTFLLVPVLMLMAFTEELLCRGYLLRNFMEASRPFTGLLVTAVIFWLMHALNTAVWSSPIPSLNLLGAGIVLGLAYLATQDLWFPTALHFGWNLAQGVVFESPVSGIVTDGVISVHPTGRLPDWLVGGDFGLEGSVLVTGAELLMAAGLLWWIRKRRAPDSSDRQHA